MPKLTYAIQKEHDGMRVDHFLRVLHGVSHRVLVSLKHYDDGILCNGEHIRTIDLVHEGDVLELNLPNESRRLPPPDRDVPVLYEDGNVLVYDKPAGMPVHQSGGHIFGTLASVYAARTDADNIFRPVNRLDKDTTGAVVVAMHQVAAGVLWKKVEKRYVAVVSGVPEPDHKTIRLPIDRIAPYEQKRVVDIDGQEAATEYFVLATSPDKSCSLVGFILHTGRTHQIRVHMSDAGHPLLGDELYDGDLTDISRQALHCAAVRFPNPMSGEKVVVHAPLPQDLTELMQQKKIPWEEPLESFLKTLD